MKTEIISPANLEKAVALLEDNELVAFPTETVYGLGGNAFSDVAVKKIFKAKGRPLSDPLIVHCASLRQAETVAEFNEQARLLAKKFWPGPLTLILPKKQSVSKWVCGGQETVAVRIPKNKIALNLIKQCGFPLAAPSANLFSRISPTSSSHVLDDLKGRIAGVIESKPTVIGVESTVLDCSSDAQVILRPGAIQYENLKVFLPKLKKFVSGMSRRSPGEFKRHYSPNTKFRLFKNWAEIKKFVEENKKKKIGMMAYNEWKPEALGDKLKVFKWGSEFKPDVLASRLYEGLRVLDKENLDVIVCPMPRGKGLYEAIANRLTKAEGEK